MQRSFMGSTIEEWTLQSLIWVVNADYARSRHFLLRFRCRGTSGSWAMKIEMQKGEGEWCLFPQWFSIDFTPPLLRQKQEWFISHFRRKGPLFCKFRCRSVGRRAAPFRRGWIQSKIAGDPSRLTVRGPHFSFFFLPSKTDVCLRISYRDLRLLELRSAYMMQPRRENVH